MICKLIIIVFAAFCSRYLMDKLSRIVALVLSLMTLFCCRSSAFQRIQLQKNRFNTILNMSTKHHKAVHVLVPVADGTEEIEASTIIDTLVRAGATVTTARVTTNHIVTCSRGVKLHVDTHISDCKTREWDMIVCPGGMPGATHLAESSELNDLLHHQQSQGKYIGAICAAPAVVLASKGLLKNKTATCYPAPKFIPMLENRSEDKVVIDGNIITSQGPGTSLLFSLHLVELLFGTEKSEQLKQEMLFH